MLTVGVITADDLPLTGLTAPKIYTQSYSVCLTAVGRDPLEAQILVSVPCWPIRTSSWNQTSISFPGFSVWTFWTKRGPALTTAAFFPDRSYDA